MVSWASGQITDGQWIYIVENDGATIVGSTAIGEVTIPSQLGGYVVKKVGAAFYGNPSVTSVVMPNSVTSIGESAFYGCRIDQREHSQQRDEYWGRCVFPLHRTDQRECWQQRDEYWGRCV
jgi:hypothetical protein